VRQVVLPGVRREGDAVHVPGMALCDQRQLQPSCTTAAAHPAVQQQPLHPLGGVLAGVTAIATTTTTTTTTTAATKKVTGGLKVRSLCKVALHPHTPAPIPHPAASPHTQHVPLHANVAPPAPCLPAAPWQQGAHSSQATAQGASHCGEE
jgi:hypothetical protein